MNQSLDDLILKKFSNRRRDRGRSRSRKRGGPEWNSSAAVPSRRRLANNASVADARFLIIRKKREKMTDARDQLVHLARHSDLRSKLDKLRTDVRKDVMRPQGYQSISKQMALNGEMSLKINRQQRFSMSSMFAPNKGGAGVRDPLRRLVKQDVFISGGTRQKPAPEIRRTVWNEPFVPPNASWPYRTIRNDSFLPRDTAMFLSDDLARPSVKRSFNDISLPTYQVLMTPQSRYNWDGRGVSRRRGDEPAQEVSTAARLLSQREEWSRRNPAKRRQELPVIHSVEIPDSDDEDVGVNGASAPLRVSSELKARLDSSSYAGRQPPAPKVASKPGHRIVVSNLHPTVIHEDIRELFEDVGTLLDSRLVRPGTAEVVYQELQDAVKAVDLYHNRHLDGQPMKCLLVSKPTSSLRSDNTTQVKLPTGTKSSIVPDVFTIHKALFNKS